MSYARPFLSLIVVGISFLVLDHFSGPAVVRLEAESAIYQGVGSKIGKVATFYGIPYAEPPVGDRRFRAPVPLSAFFGEGGEKRVIDARKKPNFCIQGPVNPFEKQSGGAGSEDCLHLNVYTPQSVLASKTLDKLPVLVYIHGGGFLYGNPLSWPFEHWVEQFPNTVIVSIYYRLSIFGFLSTPSKLKYGGIDFNAGFQDQVLALKWVKENIGSFGGDSERITIDGQSAGAASVALHLFANGGKQRLFHQAIAQSVYRPGFNRISEAKDHFEYVVRHVNCDRSGHSEAEKVECLRQKDVASLMRATEVAQRHNATWRFMPVIDGTLFQDTPTTLMVKGRISDVPILTGATADESFARSDDLESEMKFWYPALSTKDVTALSKVYPDSEFQSHLDAVTTAVGQALLRCGSETLIDVITKAGKPSYIYRFDQPNPTKGGPSVHHSAENWWMFQGSDTGSNGTYGLTPFKSTSQERFSKELIAYWISFVHTGNPTPSDSLDLPSGLCGVMRKVGLQADVWYSSRAWELKMGQGATWKLSLQRRSSGAMRSTSWRGSCDSERSYHLRIYTFNLLWNQLGGQFEGNIHGLTERRETVLMRPNKSERKVVPDLGSIPLSLLDPNMATNLIPMALDGFIVETVDERGHDEQSAPPGAVFEPVPVLMPEPRVELPVGRFGPPQISGGDASGYPTAMFSGGAQEQTAGVREENVPKESRKSEDGSKSSTKSGSSGKEKDDEKNEREHHGHSKADDPISTISYELKHDEVVSVDPSLSTDVKVLADFLRLHGFLRPSFSVMMTGTHTETRTRIVRDSNGQGEHEERYTETITDFSFAIDLSDVFSEGPVIYTVKDDVPAFRGAMTMALETGGARPIERRTLVDRTTQSVQKDAIEAGRKVGRPPWLVSGDESAAYEEAAIGSNPMASSRSFEEWLEDYIRSRRVVKEFKFAKEIFTWNLDTLTTSIKDLIRSTGYTSTVNVTFQTSPKNVHIYSPNAISKIFASYLYIFLTSIILVFPVLWLWRRFWPGAGGKWEVSGAAFRLKRWELVSGTHPGETEQAAMERLGGPPGIGGTRFRAGKDGVWVLKGVHEADWFRAWEEAIRCGVRERTRVRWLSKKTIEGEMTKANAIASGLDHL